MVVEEEYKRENEEGAGDEGGGELDVGGCVPGTGYEGNV